MSRKSRNDQNYYVLPVKQFPTRVHVLLRLPTRVYINRNVNILRPVLFQIAVAPVINGDDNVMGDDGLANLDNAVDKNAPGDEGDDDEPEAYDQGVIDNIEKRKNGFGEFHLY